MTDSYAIFGSYVLLKEVYEDDLGHLFRAGLIAGGTVERTVWLRVLDGAGMPRAAVVDAFDGAREIARRISGAQVPASSFFVEVDGVPAMGWDYLPGQPLNRVLQRARDEAFPLQPDNSLLIADKLALALVAAHAVAVRGQASTHGFLHPGLVCVSYDGDAVVSGFGLGDGLLGALEDPASAAGAYAYLAPEVLAGEAASPRSDVYSLGAIVFHLLTGTALPAAAGDRPAAFGSAFMAWDGEPLPTDIRALLKRSLASSPDSRFESPAQFRGELEHLLYGGAYSPTTFNLALFMDRLFRSEIETDEVEMRAERSLQPDAFLIGGAAAPAEPTGPEAPDASAEDRPMAAAPDAFVSPPNRRSRRILWATIGSVALSAVVAGVFWLGREIATPPAVPDQTPSAAQIAARRQAQEERLRTLTQTMVQEMMAEREEEIRQELIARQARIEELQRRLQQSERRAATSAAAAADEAATQQALVREIEEQEQEQREQQDKLEAERGEAVDETAEQAAIPVTDAPPGHEAEPVSASQPTIEPPAPVAPTVMPPASTPRPTAATVAYGAFVPPDQADSLPVVLKSQPLEWPRSAARSGSKGVVVVQLTVNAEGGVDHVEVLRADDTGWGIPEAAMGAASGYRFKPGTKAGIAITTHAFVTWRYDFTDQ